MSESNLSDATVPINREDMMSALFAHMVMQQSNMALMLLGKVPHPETGQTMRDLEAAKLFIDQVEMLEAKTKGNLSKEEEKLLKQTLMNLRLAFVESVEPPRQESKQPAADDKPLESQSSPAAGPATATAEESHKKFSKKY
jgi:hypothetical protein